MLRQPGANKRQVRQFRRCMCLVYVQALLLRQPGANVRHVCALAGAGEFIFELCRIGEGRDADNDEPLHLRRLRSMYGHFARGVSKLLR